MSCDICEATVVLGQRVNVAWSGAGPTCAKCGATVPCEGRYIFYYLGRYLGNEDWHHAFLRADGRGFVCPGCGWLHQIMFRPCGDGLRSDLFAGVEAALAVRRELEQAAGVAGKVQEADVEQPQRTASPAPRFCDESGTDAGGRGTIAKGIERAEGERSDRDKGSRGVPESFWRKLFGLGSGRVGD